MSTKKAHELDPEDVGWNVKVEGRDGSTIIGKLGRYQHVIEWIELSTLYSPHEYAAESTETTFEVSGIELRDVNPGGNYEIEFLED